MDGGQSSSNSTPPFLTKTYEMVDDRSTDAIVSWSPIGRSFVVWNPPEFAKELLPMYFKHNNFSSFVRQLNTYGFRKIDPEQWEFGNDEFVRGQRHLLKNIHRRKPIHSHSASSLVNLNHLTDSEKHEYEEEIEKLQHDKKLLMIELQSHSHEKQEFQVQLRSLGERVEGIEQRQRKLMASLAQLLQNPGFASTLMHQSDIHNKKRRLLSPQVHENSDSLSNFEIIEKLESSLTFCENFLHGVGQDSGLQTIDSTEMHASSEDPDIHQEPCSPKLNMPSPDSEFSGSTNHADSPAICSIYQDIDSRPKLSIDVNSKPVTVPDCEDEQVVVAAEAANTVAPAGANDGFWEQFLTETPGSARTQEVQSERKENVVKKIDGKLASDQGKFWWNTISNVGNLTEQMGHLTSVEKT